MLRAQTGSGSVAIDPNHSRCANKHACANSLFLLSCITESLLIMSIYTQAVVVCGCRLDAWESSVAKAKGFEDRSKCARLGSTAGRRTTCSPCCDVLAEVRQLVECWVPSIRALGKQTGPDTIGRCGSSPGEVRNCIHQSITIRSLTEWPGTQVQAFEWLRKSSDPTLVTCPSPCEPVALCGLKLVLFASSQVR